MNVALREKKFHTDIGSHSTDLKNSPINFLLMKVQ